MFIFFPLFPLYLKTLIDITSLCLILGNLLLSLISLAFVFHLTLKSRNSHHLQSFNSLWKVRILLVLFIIFWSLNELLRLPFFRRKYLHTLFSTLSITQQNNLCKVQVVLSLGLLEPGFLVTLLFLINVSIKRKTPKGSWALIFVSATCFPILTSHIFFLFVSSIQYLQLPEVFYRSSMIITLDQTHEEVLCGYPLMSSIIFGAFSIWYCLLFSLSCFKVVNLVINKRLRSRIYGLATTVLVSLTLQVFFIGFSSLWKLDHETPFEVMTLLALIFGAGLVASGEGIVVIRPIIDSLAAGDDLCPWWPNCELSSSLRRERCCGRVAVQA